MGAPHKDGTPAKEPRRHLLLRAFDRRLETLERLFDQHEARLNRLDARMTAVENVTAGLQRDRDANADAGTLEERVSELEQERD